MTLEHFAWAMQQQCENPLEKLVLIGIAEGLGSSARSWVDIERLAQFCGVPLGAIDLSVGRLGNDGFLRLHSVCAGYFDLTLGPEMDWDDTRDEHFPPGLEVQGRQFVPAEPIAPWLRQSYARYRRRSAAHHGRCWYCGIQLALEEQHWSPVHNRWTPREGFAKPVVEHQHPRSRGGANGHHNTVIACSPCNTRKRDRTVDEFRAWCVARGWWEAPMLFYGEALREQPVGGRTN